MIADFIEENANFYSKFNETDFSFPDYSNI
jgi:hypothetical protein